MKVMTIFLGLLLGALLGGCCMVSEPTAIPQGAEIPDIRMETRVHHYYYSYDPYSIYERVSFEVSEEEANKAWRNLFADRGVAWPAGSSLAVDERAHTFTVVNTSENQDRFAKALLEIYPVPRLVEFDLCFLRASRQDLSAAGFDAPDRGIDAAPVLAKLKQNKNVEIISCQRALANPLQNCVVRNVTEYIYPQDFEVKVGPCDCPSNATQRASSGVIAAEPRNFTMREVGLILDVTANPQDDGTTELIELEFKAQYTNPPVWKDYGTRLPFAADGRKAGASSNAVHYDLKMEQPFFAVSNVDTKLRVRPGTTIAIEAGSNTDTKDDRISVFFLAVRKLDIVEQK